MAAFLNDCLPPEGFFESRKALFESINSYAKPRGYAFTTQRSVCERNGFWKVYYACDRSGPPPSLERSILSKESSEGWTLKHRPDIRFAVHNHEPSLHPSAHPIHRKLECTPDLERLTNSGLAPKEIQMVVRLSGSLATRQDIYNRMADIRRDSRQGESPIHALTNQLDKEGFWSRVQYGSDNHVTAIFFAHRDSLAYLRAYPEVLLLDCMYKTNKYNMPLLDMIGVDATSRSFCIAFAFLSGETEEDYTWALQQLKELYEQCNGVFPSVILTDRCLAAINTVSSLFPSATSLCAWHANKAVLARCQPAFPITEEWNEFYKFWVLILNSPTEEIYEERLKEFESKYGSTNLQHVGYIKETWLLPFKEKLVAAWVDKQAHFGNTSTSRVEGIHALLKSYLRRSTYDLFEAWKAIQLALCNQLSGLESNQVRQHLRTPIELDKAIYRAVQGCVSYEALRKVEEQRQLQWKDPPPSPTCTGTFTRVYGLPCVHVLAERQGEPLLLQDFHSHWHLMHAYALR
ncbi:putative Mutator-like element transposase [Ceratocystis lukuohia]|uniref:Mutator-like element transposase n=1 Tax=Ceratocystis lukuohia TaxID=2019550 RepID=A0ABR4MKL7_9PEZI